MTVRLTTPTQRLNEAILDRLNEVSAELEASLEARPNAKIAALEAECEALRFEVESLKLALGKALEYRSDHDAGC